MAAHASDRRLAALTQKPRERRSDTVKIIPILLSELPVVRVCAYVSSPSSVLLPSLGDERQDVGDLFGRADDVTETADQHAAVLVAYRHAVVVADKPAQDRCSGIGT